MEPLLSTREGGAGGRHNTHQAFTRCKEAKRALPFPCFWRFQPQQELVKTIDPSRNLHQAHLLSPSHSFIGGSMGIGNQWFLVPMELLTALYLTNFLISENGQKTQEGNTHQIAHFDMRTHTKYLRSVIVIGKTRGDTK